MKTKETQQKDKTSPRHHKTTNSDNLNTNKKSMPPSDPVQQKQIDGIENSSVLPMQQKKIDSLFGTAVQREKIPEDENLLQGKFSEQVPGQFQKTEDDEKLIAQGKFSGQATQMETLEDEELPKQGKFGPVQKQDNKTGMPDAVKNKMEGSFNTDFSDVTIHPDSSKAPEVGALAYTQGHDIHFAPGQFSPNTSSGQKLLGHELAHVVQQREGRVKPTTEIGGLPVNDNPALENEADKQGNKASS